MDYIVIRLGKSPQNPPQVLHATMGDARDEARRLATKHPGCTFLVAQALTAYCTAPEPIELGLDQMPLRKK
jgi:hypothetical protein